MNRLPHHSLWGFVKAVCLYFVIVVGVFAVFANPISTVFAQPSYTINYQGKLTDETGLTVADGAYDMEFKLYTAPTGGSAVWTETRTGGNVVTVQNGLFSVMLGSVTSLSSVNFNQPLYFGVNIEADGEMTPRKILGTVPSAFEAQKVGGIASSSFLRSDAADSASGLLTFTGGVISTASSTVSRLSFLNATGTSLYIGGDRITDFTGTNLELTGNSLGLSSTYLGQTSITTLGTITTGTWTGSTINSTYLDSSVLLTSELDSCSEFAALGSIETGTCGSLVLSDSPSITGTLDVETSDFSGTMTLSGTAANIALGSNYLSGDGQDEGIFVDASGNVGIGTSTINARLDIALVDSSATAANSYGSQISIIDSGVVTTGSEYVAGSSASVTRTGATGGTHTIVGVSADVAADGGGAGTVNATGGSFGVQGGADVAIGLSAGVFDYSGGDSSATTTSLKLLNFDLDASAKKNYGIYNELNKYGAVLSGTETTYGSYTRVYRLGDAGGTITNYGDYISVAGHTGGTQTNYGTYVTVSGADTNYSGIFMGGNFGIGDATPSALFTVGNGDLFQVNSSGYVTAPLYYGGSTASSQLILRSTSGSGTTDDIIFGMGANGGTQWGRLDNENNSVAFGEYAGATFTSNTTGNIALGLNAGRYASTTNADANAYIGGYAGENNTGNNNLLFGGYAGYNNSGAYNIMQGASAGYNNTGSYNIFSGDYTGWSNSGSFSIFSGYYAGSDSTGSKNNFLGYYAGYNNSGNNNNFLGEATGYNNTGNNNNFLGYSAGDSNTGNYNTFLGDYAGYNNTGSTTIMMGYRAGEWLQASSSVVIGGEAMTGSHATTFIAPNNVVIGQRAGYAANDGAWNNILLGYQAADNLTTGNNNIIIGYDIDNVTATADNRLNIGNLIFGTGLDGTGTSIASGNIGIGSTSPTARLTVTKSDAGTTADNLYASIIDVTDTGVVTTGTDTTYGQRINATRNGATGGTISLIGQSIRTNGDFFGAGTDYNTGQSVFAQYGDYITAISATAYNPVNASSTIGISNGVTALTNKTGDIAHGIYTSVSANTSASSGAGNVYGNRTEVNHYATVGGTFNNYGDYIVLQGNTGGTQTNYGQYVTVSGADTNYSGIFMGGNFGIGDSTPAALFTVGNGDLFQINSSGVIASSNNITPNSILTTGQTDEYCLTYEGTGTTFEWQSCASGSLTTANLDTSAELAGILNDETGYSSGALAVFSISPTFTGTISGDQADFTGTVNFGNQAYVSSNGYARMEDGIVGSPAFSFENDTNTGIWTSGADTLAFSTAGTQRLTIGSTGNIGVGTTTPNQKLSIFNSAADSAIEFSSLTGSPYKWTAGIDYSDGAKFKIASSSALGTNDRFVIDGNGKVGVGTASPQRLLHIYGTGDSKLLIEGTDGGASSVTFKNTQDEVGIGLGSDEKFHIGSDGTNPGAGTWLTIDTVGNVGIGDTTPASLFTVGSGDLFQINSNGGFSNTVATGIAGAITNTGTSNSFVVNDASGDTTPFVVDAGGWVGIGSSTPDSELTVRTNSGTGLHIYQAADANTLIEVEGAGNTWYQGKAASSAGSYYAFKYNNGNLASSPQFVISTAGNIGIGTTSPYAKLSVAGDSVFTGHLTMSGTAANIALGSNFINGDTDDEGLSVSAGGVGTFSRTSGSVGNSLTLNNTSSGVGSGNQLSFQTGGSTDNALISQQIMSSGNSDLYFTVRGSNTLTERMRITAAGNVGIGTSSPATKLTVAGDIYVTGAFKDTSGDAGTSGQVLLSTLTGTNWSATSTLGLLAAANIDTSAELKAIVTDESGTGGSLVFSTSPTFGGTVEASSIKGGDVAGAVLGLKPTGNSSPNSTSAITFNYGNNGGSEGARLAGNTGYFNVGGDTVPDNLFSVGATSQFQINSSGVIASSNNITPNSILTTGQTDEYCLTYEGTGTTFEWQTCGGSSLFTDGGANTYLTDTADNLSVGGTGGSAKLNVYGYVDIAQVASGISFMGTRFFYASSTNETIAIGDGAGDGFNSGTTHNIALGYLAGYNSTNSNADHNILLGYQAGYSNTSYNNIIMGEAAGSSNTGNNNNMMGFWTGQNNTGNQNNFFGNGAGYENTGGNNNLFGFDTGVSNDGSDVNIFGASAGYNNQGNYNNIFGAGAGYNNTGEHNNLIGYGSGHENTGSHNNALGYWSGYNNIGLGNNFFGNYAGYNNTGSWNEMIGYNAGRFLQSTSSVALGAEALYGSHSTTYMSVNNVAVGFQAGYASDDGSGNNILIGYRAADNLTTGNNNIVIGYDIDNLTATADNRLNIGNLIFGTGLDGTGTTLASGNIGIGSSTPIAKLSVSLSSTNTTAENLYGGYTYINDTGNVSSGSDDTYGQYLNVTRTGASGGSLNTYGQYIDMTGDTGGSSELTGQIIDLEGSDRLTGAEYYLTGGTVTSGDILGTNVIISRNSTTGGFTVGNYVDIANNANFTTQNQMYGSYNTINKNNNASADSEIFGSYNSIYNSGGTGLNDSYGVYSSVVGDADGTSVGYAYFADVGGADTSYMFYGSNSASSGKTLYGLYVDTGAGAGTEYAAILNGGNVGIGTSTPTSKLAVKTALPAYSTAFQIISSDNNKELRLGYENGTYDAGVIQATGYGSGRLLALNPEGGNIAIGTTTSSQKLSIFGSAVDTAIELSAASGSSYKWTMGIDYSDAGKFKIASSSALGTSDRLTINGNGYVGIGTTSPAALLHVSSGGPVPSIFSGTGLVVNRSSSADSNAQVSIISGTTGSAVLAFGDTSLEKPGGITYSNSTNSFTFRTNATDQMTLTSSGNLGIGTTTPNTKLQVNADAATAYAGFFFNDGNNANRYGLKIQGGADDASGTTYYLDAYDGDGGQVGYIANTSGTFALTDVSDIRTKVNVTNTEIVNAADVINALRVVDFNRKQDPDGPRITGFIAQEVESVFPYAVTENPKTGYLGVMKDAFVPLLIKGAQEQQAVIDVHGTSLATLADTISGTITSIADLEASLTKGLSDGYDSEDDTLEAGEIVMLATTSPHTVARAVYGQVAFGVIANNDGTILDGAENGIPIAQAGKVAVKVNGEGGRIKIGDAITLSSEAGIGTRATTTSRIIGIALDDESGDGMVQIAVRNELYFASETTTAFDSLFASIENNENDTLWNRITTLASNFVDGVLTIAGIKTDELCVGNVCVDEEAFLEIVEQSRASQSATVQDSEPNSPNETPVEPEAPAASAGEVPPEEEQTGPIEPPVEEVPTDDTIGS